MSRLLPNVHPGEGDDQWRARVGMGADSTHCRYLKQFLRRFPFPNTLARHFNGNAIQNLSMGALTVDSSNRAKMPGSRFSWACPLHQWLDDATHQSGQEKVYALNLEKSLAVASGVPLTKAGSRVDFADKKDSFGISYDDLDISSLHRGLPEYYGGTLLVLGSASSFNYYHWMLEHLPRIQIARRNQIDYNAVYAPVDTPFQRQSLEMAGELKNTIAYERRRKVLAQQLVFLSRPHPDCLPTASAVQFLEEISLGHRTTATKWRRLFIPRMKTANRCLVNWDEAFRLLEPHGFEINDLADLSVHQQARLFSECEMIVAAHGAALTNLVFCQKGTYVLELMQSDYVHWCYGLISDLKGLDYTALASGAASYSHLMDECSSDILLSQEALARLGEWTACITRSSTRPPPKRE